MNDQANVEDLLAFFKAIADANRLKIIAILAKDELSVEQLAEILKLNPSTVSHHLSRLAKVGLVSARAEGYYSVYRLELKALSDLSQRLLSVETLPAIAADVDINAYDRKVLNTYLSPDGKIMRFPVQRKKEEAVIRHVSKVFEAGRRYTEKQINEIVSQFSEDTAHLRRSLIAFGFMEREGGGGAYWLKEKNEHDANLLE